MGKAVDALAGLKRFKEEIELLQQMLSQRRWRKGKRGYVFVFCFPDLSQSTSSLLEGRERLQTCLCYTATDAPILNRIWYDRLALIYMHHLHEPQKAMEIVIEALNDPLTHLGTAALLAFGFWTTSCSHIVPLFLVLRPRLQKRLARLEKQLKIPDDEKHFCEAKLRKATEVTIQGDRIYTKRAQSLVPITSFFIMNAAERDRESSRARSSSRDVSMPRGSMSRNPSIARTSSDPMPFGSREGSLVPKTAPTKTMSGSVGIHSVWKSTAEEGGEIGVEEVALEYYATLGYQG